VVSGTRLVVNVATHIACPVQSVLSCLIRLGWTRFGRRLHPSIPGVPNVHCKPMWSWWFG